ncbi:helix-turn-helix domain-containing protein [Roseomonas aerophila]|uniref:Helix-turn-helix domain-containing protein n=1 Tax=Teichococcus aerophilus TaxID=1224513 RepID=A0ABR7RF91_9PROT|nr:IclR family transcriptional regulator C-terminal domain-containing protein [Pseudoroseomonas aerophila]MBC9205229.1 helix-turn-helix domain-containing protein [Pseudoroseomonas aerophila]
MKDTQMARQPDLDRDPLLVRSVGKAFALLSAFDARNPSLSLTQLAIAAGLDRSATQRFAHTLEPLGYLRKDARSKRFTLNVRVMDLTARFLGTDPLVAVARPYLLHLSQTTHETVNLSMRDGTDTVFVNRLLGQHVLNVDVPIGTRMPLYCTSFGIAILSTLPTEEARSVLLQSDRKRLTEATVWEMEPLMEKITLSAARGYATTAEEIYHGDVAVAAPIVNGRGRPLGAVNVASLRSRIALEEMERRYATLVMETARSISNACAALG